MKDDESIEQMYSRFQTLVSGIQILKKSYVASDHVSKILKSLPARWRPKVIAIEEAKDLNTLSVEDLVSSLKVHEIGLNEHEPAKWWAKPQVYGFAEVVKREYRSNRELFSLIYF